MTIFAALLNESSTVVLNSLPFHLDYDVRHRAVLQSLLELTLMILIDAQLNLMLPPLHPFVFTNKEFLEMLAEKEENYGKEIFRKHIVITGAEFYFKLVKEAIDHGFKG